MRPLVLVTGTQGFLGSQIVTEAHKVGFCVRASGRGKRQECDPDEYCTADILIPDSLTHVFKNVDYVIHAAGLAHIMDKSQSATAPFTAVNADGTANVMRAAADAGVRHVVLVSSVAVYGDHGGQPVDEQWDCQPAGRYAESKLAAELRAKEIARASGVALTILRFSTMYGPGDPGNVGRLIRVIDRGRFIWIGSGDNRKSIIHRDDAARACISAVIQVGSMPAIRTYNVSAPSCAMHDLVNEITKCLGRRVPPLRIPGPVAHALADIAAHSPVARSRIAGVRYLVDKWLVDDEYKGAKFERDYHFTPLVTLTEGIRQEVTWYREQLRPSLPGVS